jgi:hypothetical protein
VTHEDLRALLSGYAAGTLDSAESRAVQTHLASGCTECLREVFERPVGLPRFPAQPPVLEPRPEARPRPGWPARQVAVLAGGLGLALAAVWVIGELRGRERAYRAQAEGSAVRAAELEAQRGALSARIAALAQDLETARRDLDAAREEAAREALAARDVAEADAELRHRYEADEARIADLTRTLRAREAELARLRMDGAVRGAQAELLATPGLEVLRLGAVAPFRDVRGHVLWHPARDTLLLYASGLPPLPAGSIYRVHVDFDDGSERVGPAFGAGTHGALTLAIPLGEAAERLHALRVVLEPADEPVLAGVRLP